MSDIQLQQAFRVIKQHGQNAVAQMLAFFPIIRHDKLSYSTRWRLTSHIEREDEWDKWRNEIPEIEFDPGWKVRVIPPLVGAIVRFRVNGISVYLDCYARLGIWDGPYWELYPAEDGDTERYSMHDMDGLLDGLRRAIARQEAE